MAKRYDYIDISREIRHDLEDSLKQQISEIDFRGIIKEALEHFHIDINDVDFEDKSFKLALERGLYYALNAVKRDIKVDMGEIDLGDFITLGRDEMNNKIRELFDNMKKAFAEGNKELGQEFQDQFFAAMTVATSNNIPFLKAFSDQWKKAYAEALDDLDMSRQTRFQNLKTEILSQMEDFKRTQIIAENTIHNIRQSLGGGATDEDVQGVLGKVLPQLTQETQKASSAQEEFQGELSDTSSAATITAKSLEELVELYHQLGTTGGSKKSLDEVSKAILDIIQAEKQLDSDEMLRFSEILKGLVASGGESPILAPQFSVEEAMDALKKLQEMQKSLDAARSQNQSQSDMIGHLQEENSELESAKESLESMNNALFKELATEKEFSANVGAANDDLRESLYIAERDLEVAKEKTAELEEQIELLKKQKEEAENDADYNAQTANSYWIKNEGLISQLSKANGIIEDLEDRLKYAEQVSEQTASTGIFNSSNTSELVSSLEKISSLLEDIRNTLGTIDDNSGFKNLISSIDELLTKLQAIQSKVGTGVYNIQVHQGVNKEALAASQSTDALIKAERARYAKAFDKVAKKAGGEEMLFSYINAVQKNVMGISNLQETFGSLNVAQISSAEEKIQRYQDFFKILKEAMASPYFGLDLKGIRLPTADDSAFRQKLKEVSLPIASEEEMANLQDDSQMLADIVKKLEEIRDLLTAISQNNAFSEMFDNAIVRLDELLNGLKELNASAFQNQVDVVREQLEFEQKRSAELETQNALLREQLALSLSSESTSLEELNEKLALVTQSIVEKTQAFSTEADVVDTSVQRELSSLEELRLKLLEVVSAIQAKTQAFQEENGIVDSVVNNEVSLLNELKAKLGDITSVTETQGTEGEVESFNNLKDAIVTVQEAIANKNNALREEAQVVASELPKEIQMFEKLSGILTFIAQRIAGVAENISKIQRSDVGKLSISEEKQRQKEEADQRKRAAQEEERQRRAAEQEQRRADREHQRANNKAANEIIQYYHKLQNSELQYQKLLARRDTLDNLNANETATLAIMQAERDAEGQRLSILQEITVEVARARAEYMEMVERAEGAASDAVRKSLVDSITKNIDKLNTKLNSGKYTNSSVGIARDQLAQMAGYVDEIDVERLQAYADTVKQIDRNLVKVGNNTKLTKLLGDVNSAIADNTKMSSELKDNFVDLAGQIEEALNVGASADEVQKLSTRFLQLKNTMVSTGQTGHKFLSLIKNDITQASARMIAQYMSFQDWVRYIRNAVTAVQELDSALNQLKIVSNATDAALSSISKDAYNLANRLGMSTTEVVSSITEWRRLGKTIDESMTLAEQAARLSTGGLMDINSATTALVSSMQAFEMGAEEASKIVDQYIYLGNNYAITSESLATSLTKSMAALKVAGNSLEEIEALEVAGNAMVQDADVVSNSLKVNLNYCLHMKKFICYAG